VATQLKIRQRLMRGGSQQVTKAGLALSPACGQMVEKMIHTGVQRLNHGHMLEDESRLRLAEDNLRRVLRRAGEEAFKAGTFPVVEDQAFTKSLKDLCPLWPYC